MKRRLALIALIVATASLAWFVSSSSAVPAASERVVIVLAPYLSWSDIDAHSTPTLWRLAENGAVGDVNARSRAREGDEPPSPLEGALGISSGAWAVPDFDAPAAYNIEEPYEVGTAAEAFRRMTGEQVGQNRIVFLGYPMTQRTNAERGPEAVLGTLGQAVEANGGMTAAVGNSDVGYVTGEQRRVRPAALAAMDANGLVRLGDVSRHLLAEDPNAPFGIKTDLDYFAQAIRQVSRETAEKGGPALVVLDPGDGYRAQKFQAQVTTAIAAQHREAAVHTLDEVVKLTGEQFPDATIMVVTSANGDPESGNPEGLGPIIVSGKGWDGYLVSDSTQRPGLVTNLDVSAAALDAMGIESPVRVIGNPLRVAGSPRSLSTRIEHLVRMDTTAVAVDAAKAGVVNGFVGLTVAALLLSGLVLVRGRHWSDRAVAAASSGVRALLLFVLCIPVSSWLMYLWMPWPSTSFKAVLALGVTAVVSWAVAMVVFRRSDIRIPIAFLSLVTVLVILVDQWLGGPASFTNFFGYSPLLAARFYGMGNEAAAIVFGASVVGSALLFDRWAETSWVAKMKRFALPLLAVLVVGTAAAPFFGANIGVAIWGIVGFVLAWILMNDHHVSWKSVIWMAAGVILVIAAFAAVDLLGGGSQTHLARSLQSAGRGGIGELWLIVARKAATNMRVLTRTNWSWILISTLGFLGVMRWRPHGDFAATLRENRHFADAITVSLAAGIVAYFTEDSGIVIPALEVFYVGVALAGIMLSRHVGRPMRPKEEISGGAR